MKLVRLINLVIKEDGELMFVDEIMYWKYCNR